MSRKPEPPRPGLLHRTGRAIRGTVRAEAKAAHTTLRTLNRYGNLVSVGVAARQGFAKAQDDGKSGHDAALAAAREAALPLGVVLMPVLARTASANAKSMYRHASEQLKQKLPSRMSAARRVQVELAANRAAARAKALGNALSGVAAGARFVRPAVLAIAAYQGAKQDDNWLRGAGRGFLTTFDPSAIVLEKGAVETLYDRIFGQASGKQAAVRQARLDGREFHERPLYAAAPRGAMQPALHTGAENYYVRTYTKGPKKGTTEIVQRRHV